MGVDGGASVWSGGNRLEVRSTLFFSFLLFPFLPPVSVSG